MAMYSALRKTMSLLLSYLILIGFLSACQLSNWQMTQSGLQAIAAKKIEELTTDDISLLLSVKMKELCDSYGLDITLEPSGGLILPNATMATPVVILSPELFVVAPLQGQQSTAAPNQCAYALYLTSEQGDTPFEGFTFGMSLDDLPDEDGLSVRDGFAQSTGGHNAENLPIKQVEFISADLYVTMYFEQIEGKFIFTTIAVNRYCE